ncbi:MAG: biopolymer transporter ExbD [Leptospiraceae bacterium]|nr:biopolymer transporter ExbD [Leptospiraceae bacterium]MCB1320157.1 biopolymer transporter ExbD [Leptospiraceae bacterium]
MKIKRKSREIQDIPLASTADIAFLLIVFYLAASSLLEFRGVEIPVPRKDAPPMQILRDNIFRVEINATGQFIHADTSTDLDTLQKSVRESFQKNPELVIVVRVDPEAPSERIPQLVRRLQDERIERISIGLDR